MSKRAANVEGNVQKAGERLLKTTLKNYRKVWEQNIKKRGVSVCVCVLAGWVGLSQYKKLFKVHIKKKKKSLLWTEY